MRHCLVLVLCALFAPGLPAQDAPAGFTPLYNGMDLAGWDFLNCTKEDWVVEDGTLSTRAGKVRQAAWLLTGTQHEDFELRLEYLLTKGADSGVALRTAGTGAPHIKGIELQLVDDVAYPKLKPQEATGGLLGVAAPAKKAGHPPGQWNTLHVTMNERKLKVVINDITVQDVDLGELKGPEGLRREAGHIGLQTRVGVVKFRNVLVKPLSEAAAQGKFALTLDVGGHTARIAKVFFTRDGQRLVTSSADQTVRVWDVASGEPRQVLRPPGMATAMALSPTEDKVAVASKYYQGKAVHHVIYVMRLEDGGIDAVLRGHKERIINLAFSHDGNRLASSSEDQTIRIWNPADGKTTGMVEKTMEAGGICLSPTGDRVACTIWGGDTKIFETATGKFLTKLAKPAATHRYHGVAWTPDGKTLVTSTWGDKAVDKSAFGPGGVFLWDPDGTQRPPLTEAPFRSNGLALSRDGKWVLLPWDTNPYHRASVLDLETGKPVVTFAPTKSPTPGYPPPRYAWSGDLSPDKKLAATTAGGEGLHQVFLWRTLDGKLVHRLAARSWLRPGQPVSWGPDGKSVGWGNLKAKTCPLFDLGELQLGSTTSPEKLRGPRSQEGELTLERQEPSKRYWEMQVVKNKEVIARLGVPHVPSAVSFVSPERVAMASDYGRFFLHDVGSQKPIREFKLAEGKIPGTSMITSVAPSPDKRLLATVGIDQMLRIWNPERDRPILTFFVHGEDWIIWTEEGYYAATPGGERLIGWTVDNGIDKALSFHPAERFRKQLYRPDLIKLVLEKGSVAEALKAADAASGVKTRVVETVEELLPPKVTLTIVDQKAMPVIKVKASAVAVVKGQPVTTLRLMLDGRPLSDPKMTLRFDPGKDKVEAEFTVTIPEGKHTLTAFVRSPDATSASDAVAIHNIVQANLPAMHVLAIGINDHKDISLKLNCAKNDAQSIAKTFKAASKGNLFREVNTEEILDQQATRAYILTKIDDLRQRAAKSPNDLAVIFFAGHGIKKKDAFFLLTHEADLDKLEGSSLSGDDLRKALGEFPCQVLLMLDACNSAGFGQGKKLAKLGLRPATDDVSRSLTDNDIGVAVFCAAMGHEKAKEEQGNGLFTRAVMDALTKMDEVPFNRVNRLQYLHHVHSHVFDLVSAWSEEKQHPFLNLPWTTESRALRELPKK